MRASSLLIISLYVTVSCQEVDQPASLLGPRNFNHHAYEAAGYLNDLPVEPTKQGPVLFPNDGPPPPRPPLIVTSRPLIEQVARSELNRNPVENNSIAEQSQINRVQVSQPSFLARIKSYAPFNYPTPTPPTPVHLHTGRPYEDYQNYPEPSRSNFEHPYADVVRKSQIVNADRDRGHRYSDYEEQSVLPPIYKALSDHANEKVLKIQQKKLHSDYAKYQDKEPDYSNDYSNDLKDDDNTRGEYNKGKKYAFSYSVRDHKTGDDFSHSQHSTGQATNGEYRVRLPDGRMQIVSYVADEFGYKADVRYDEDKTIGNAIEQYQPQKNYLSHESPKSYTPHEHVTPKNYVSYETPKNYIAHETPQNYNLQTPKPPTDDYYQYIDISKEYNTDYNDYSDKNNNYNVRKFAAYDPNAKNKIGVIVVPNQLKSSTVKPSYEELKPLFVTRKPYSSQSTQSFLYQHPFDVSLNVPSTISDYQNNELTTERVVIIGTSKSPFYTNIKNSYPSIPVTTPSPIFDTVTPSFRSALTPSLKSGDFTNDKAVLSSSFLERINKYLNYN